MPSNWELGRERNYVSHASEKYRMQNLGEQARLAGQKTNKVMPICTERLFYSICVATTKYVGLSNT
jgi:hypothetical protein